MVLYWSLVSTLTVCKDSLSGIVLFTSYVARKPKMSGNPAPSGNPRRYLSEMDSSGHFHGDETLSPDDLAMLLADLMPAQNKSYNLGLNLKLPPYVVEAIHAKNQSAADHLRDVLTDFLKGVGSRPTWRVIVDALRSPTVNLHTLAEKIASTHGLVDTQRKEHTSREFCTQ